MISGASLFTLFAGILNLFNALIPVLIGAALVLFLWGIIKYVTGGGKARDEAIQYIVWGIIAMFVMVSVWGLVGILTGSFSLQTPTVVPSALPGPGQGV